MAIEYKNDDFVLAFVDASDAVSEIVHKYEAFLDALTTAELNGQLREQSEEWQYFFYFLAPEDYDAFFQAVADRRHPRWQSRLMQDLTN